MSAVERFRSMQTRALALHSFALAWVAVTTKVVFAYTRGMSDFAFVIISIASVIVDVAVFSFLDVVRRKADASWRDISIDRLQRR